ncbi:MAG: DotD/TraH family lipoprotein [Deltaproteobacteria bacterium]|jgi:hypothetical protein|nr:DotD/TraH family lipoprotein [Deltaproteobacteria bacterium]
MRLPKEKLCAWRLFPIGAALLLAFGCGAGRASPTVEAETIVDRNLREAGEIITRDFAILTGSEQNRDNGPWGNGSLYEPMTLVWNGPIEDGLSRIAARIGYKVEISGKSPVVPLMVRVKQINRPALSILRDIGEQTGPHEGIELDESLRLIRLIYEKRGDALP